MHIKEILLLFIKDSSSKDFAAVLRIRTIFVRIRIQIRLIGSDPDPAPDPDPK